MRVKNSFRWVVLVGLCVGTISSATQTAASEIPKLRYGFQANREYPYKIEFHAKVMDTKIDRQGELIYNVLSANEDQAVLKLGGSAVGQLTNFGVMTFRHMGPPHLMASEPEGTTISRRGTILVSGELKHMPMLLGDLETLVIDEFPDEAKATWEKQRDIVIQETQSRHHPFGPPIPMPRATSTAKHSAKEVTQFTITDTSDDLVRISKKQSLKSGETDKVTRFEMTGSGTIEFDRKQGVTKKLSMTYEVKVNESGVSLTIPVTVTASLLSPSEWAELKKKQEEAAKASQAAAAEAARSKPFKPGEREELIEQLNSTDDGKLIAAAKRLAKAIRDDKPEDFSRPLAEMLSKPNAWVQAPAAEALIVWATPEAEEALVELVKVDNFMYCRQAIAALATLKTENAAEAVATQMPRYRDEAAKALKSMGPVAENATIPLLKNTDIWMRGATIDVLGEIGGEDSVRALRKLAKGLSEYDSRLMRQAITKIQHRLATMPKDTASLAKNARKKQVEPSEKNKSETAAAGNREMRTWHDTSGRFEIEASLVSVDDQTVTLKKKNGHTIRVPLKKLSEEDREFVQKQAEDAFGSDENNG